jgi:hypothetical protein
MDAERAVKAVVFDFDVAYALPVRLQIASVPR